ncbi:MAG: START domain-containing protein [Sphingobacteriales bacterium]
MHKKLLLFLLLFKVLPASAQSDWTFNSKNEGIKIYTSIVPNSKIKAIKVECDYKATPSQFVAVLLDIKNSPEWLYHTKFCKVFKQVSPQDLYYYSEVTLPWPAENRDFVSHLTVSQNPITKVVLVNGPAVPGFIPVKSDIVRVAHSGSQWEITPLNNDEIRVIYTLHVDPGGALPAWLINMFATEAPTQIFKNLKTELQKSAYKNATLAFIQN